MRRMLTRPQIQRLPWDRIAIVLSTAVVVAWTIGFAIGMVVNFFTRVH
jgi:hypothetical protein